MMLIEINILKQIHTALVQGAVTYVPPVEAFVTVIKFFDQEF